MSEMATSQTAVSLAAVEAYLDALYAAAPDGSLVEVRYRTRSAMGRTFHRAADRGAIAAEVARRSPATDVYLGVIPRRRRGGGRDDLVPQARVLWVDCDTPEAAAALATASPRPSIVVASGTATNRHGYWLLSEPASLDAVEEGNRRLAIRLGGDLACADAARILRPPSLNHKHQPPSAVRLELCSPGPRHRIAAVVGEAAVDRLSRPGRGPVLALDDPLRRVSPAVYVERLAGVAVPRHRKIRCPFHDDRTPSLHVYEDGDRGWYCYGCARGGSIYDFAAHMWGVETRGETFNGLHDALCAVFGPEDLRQA
jgi:CHC2 zinc finger